MPATDIFPDTDAGNDGLCCFEASLAVMPKEPVTAQQIAAQNTAIDAFRYDPESTIYHALGNITNPVMIIAGALDHVASVQDDIVLVAEIPNATFLQFGDAGHAALLQHAIEAGQLISVFLNDDLKSSKSV